MDEPVARQPEFDTPVFSSWGMGLEGEPIPPPGEPIEGEEARERLRERLWPVLRNATNEVCGSPPAQVEQELAKADQNPLIAIMLLDYLCPSTAGWAVYGEVSAEDLPAMAQQYRETLATVLAGLRDDFGADLADAQARRLLAGLAASTRPEYETALVNWGAYNQSGGDVAWVLASRVLSDVLSEVRWIAAVLEGLGPGDACVITDPQGLEEHVRASMAEVIAMAQEKSHPFDAKGILTKRGWLENGTRVHMEFLSEHGVLLGLVSILDAVENQRSYWENYHTDSLPTRAEAHVLHGRVLAERNSLSNAYTIYWQLVLGEDRWQESAKNALTVKTWKGLMPSLEYLHCP